MVQLTIRCTNGADAADATPHVDVEFLLLTEAPYWRDEATDDEPAVGGYKSNGIAMRRAYALAQMPFGAGLTAASASTGYTQADYEYRVALLRARRLFIIDVKYSDDEHPRRTFDPDDVDESLPYWLQDFTDPDNPVADFTPIEVRRTGNSVTDERTRFRWTLELEDCLPIVGVEIP